MSINHNDEGDPNYSDIQTELNLTPLIDIMLVLLIIFMVTSSISLESGLDIDLPKTTSETNTKSSTAIILSLNSQGDIFLQGKKIKIESIKEVLTKMIKEQKTDEVIFEGDTTSSLGKVIQLMDLAKTAGAGRFAIATKEE